MNDREIGAGSKKFCDELDSPEKKQRRKDLQAYLVVVVEEKEDAAIGLRKPAVPKCADKADCRKHSQASAEISQFSMNLAVVSRKISCLRHNTSLSLLSRVVPVDVHAIQARAAHSTATRKRRPANDSIDLDSYSEEAQLKFIRRAQIVGQNQGIDIWAHPVDTLGAHYLGIFFIV